MRNFRLFQKDLSSLEDLEWAGLPKPVEDREEYWKMKMWGSESPTQTADRAKRSLWRDEAREKFCSKDLMIRRIYLNSWEVLQENRLRRRKMKMKLRSVTRLRVRRRRQNRLRASKRVKKMCSALKWRLQKWWVEILTVINWKSSLKRRERRDKRSRIRLSNWRSLTRK